MRNLLLLVVLALALAVGPATPAAADAGPDTDGPPDDDLGVLLTGMFATMADVLAAYQDRTANEAYLGSAAATHRLSSAIVHVAPVTIRSMPRPFAGACLFCDD